MLYYERRARLKGFKIVIGIDEAGRGPLAGPVVAAAVLLKRSSFKNRVDDSKKLTPNKRVRAFEEIIKNADIGLGVINEETIDKVNILSATSLAMESAVLELLYKIKKKYASVQKHKICLLIDGKVPLNLPYHKKDIIGADGKSLSCAAASIVAKVIRDRIMTIYDRIYPDYSFITHKGYATAAHYQAIKQFGPCVIHRKTFRLE